MASKTLLLLCLVALLRPLWGFPLQDGEMSLILSRSSSMLTETESFLICTMYDFVKDH